MKVVPLPSFDNIIELYCTANFCLKKETETVSYPILVNVEASEQDKSSIRFSFRAGIVGDAIKNL